MKQGGVTALCKIHLTIIVMAISCISILLFGIHVDGILFQLVNGSGVFLGVLQPTVAEQAGNSLDVGSVIEDVHGKGMAYAMPTDVLVDTGTLHPSLDGLTAAFV